MNINSINNNLRSRLKYARTPERYPFVPIGEKAIFLGDLHPDYPNLNPVAAEIVNRTPDYVINGGDIYADGTVAEFAATLGGYSSFIAAENYYHVKGDHELDLLTVIGDLTLGTNIFPIGTTWDYLVLPNGGAFPTDWKLASFDDSSWTNAVGSFGYGGITGKTIATTITSGRINYLFRKTINKTSITSTGVVIELSVDDACEIYLNGNMVYSINMMYPITPTSTEVPEYLIDTLIGEGSNQVIRIPSSLFIDGDNQIAVLLKNGATTSSDVFFEMAMHNYTFASTPFLSNGRGDGLQDYLPYLPAYAEQYTVVQNNIEYFFITSGRENETSFVASPSGQGPTSQQAAWLKQALADSTADFKVLVSHDAPVTRVFQKNRQNLDYLLGNTDYPIDVMLVADTHLTEAYVHSSGLVVFNASNQDNSGRPINASIQATTPSDWTDLYTDNGNGNNYFLEITRDDNYMQFDYRDKDGNSIFKHLITK